MKEENKIKGQSSAEYSILFTVSVFLTLMFFGISVMNVRELLEQKKEYEIEKVLDEWYYIANDIWIQGNGSSYIWEGSLPEGYNATASGIRGNSIVIVYDSREYVKSFEDFTVSGSMPTSYAGIRINISNDGSQVVFTPI